MGIYRTVLIYDSVRVTEAAFSGLKKIEKLLNANGNGNSNGNCNGLVKKMI